MGTPTSQLVDGRRTRPKDRRERIAMAAAIAFSERGYHQVSLSEVAAEVGISAPALYRHFPNKYALFAEAARRLAHGLIEATDAVAGDDFPDADAASLDDPRSRLDAVLLAVIDATIENRRTGGLYHWEGRYLHDDDRERLRADFAELAARVRRPVAALRPELPAADVALLAAGALSVVASITDHRTALAQRAISDLLLASAEQVIAADLPASALEPHEPAPGVPSASKREAMVRAAISLFHRNGYHETSVEEISAAVGITASGLYRHFSGKGDILLEACVRAAERLAATTADALGGAATPREALQRLIDAYVDHSFAHHELMSVYFSDVGALPEADRSRLRSIQRRHVEEWVSLVAAVRTDLSPTEARFAVHAGLNTVVDLGRLVHFDRAPETRARVGTIVRAALGV
ncbi:TetR/AcrR family transcriptional regulator [Agromyces sp. MMS24-JH15]|uniref:TetR/AcrR family transcriptional regulator n=1 Tax=Agromyces sp. MMS24-JH15 TaxID=3243765 RepID=UPI00374A4903